MSFFATGRLACVTLSLCISTMLAACGGGGGGSGGGGALPIASLPTPTAAKFTIGGNVQGLDEGDTVVLQNNGKDDLTVNGNKEFAFPITADEYAVSVRTQPSQQFCTVYNAKGKAIADVRAVTVICASSAPNGVAVDSSRNVYVTENSYNLIRKISPAGEVTTLAGAPTLGRADGKGAAASFGAPTGIAVDINGYVYVSERGNKLIRKITPAGDVMTLAGSGHSGTADGTGSAASFTEPQNIAVDANGNIYVADSFTHLIRKITPAGVVTTLAGSGNQGSADGVGTAASFCYPYGVALDAGGNVYVADALNNKIRKITPAGAVTTLAGSGEEGSANGKGTAASFYYPKGVAVDADGNIYVADNGKSLIRKITPAGDVTTLAGSGNLGSADGKGSAASFRLPTSVAVDAQGNVYVADKGNRKIRKITPIGEVSTLAAFVGP